MVTYSHACKEKLRNTENLIVHKGHYDGLIKTSTHKCIAFGGILSIIFTFRYFIMFFTNRYELSTFIKRCETFKTWWDNVHMLVRKSCEILKNLVVLRGTR